MAVRLTTTSHALLGLLSITPMSGYDLFQAVEGSVSRFWPISKSQVYAELARLERLGLIEGTRVPQERLPDKRVFQLTEAGEQALDSWLDSGELEEVRFRIPFLLKVLFGHRRPPQDTAKLLESVKNEAASQAKQYAALVELLESAPEAVYPRVAVLFGLRMAEAIAAWAAQAQSLLPDQPYRLDPRRRPGTAAAMLRAVPKQRGRG